MFQNIIVSFVVVIGCVSCLLPRTPVTISPARSFQTVGGQRFGNDFEGFDLKVLGPLSTFNLEREIEDDDDDKSTHYTDNYDQNKKQNFNLNVGKALEVLRRELPMCFAVSNLDFSVFASSITVNDGKNSIGMTKSLYTAAVKSLRMASAISSMYPSMNVKKIEYLEDSRTIQCHVDVVLPDSVRVDGQAVWEGMFFFGLDSTGLINTHIFDRKVTPFKPAGPVVSKSSIPWLRSAPSGGADFLRQKGALQKGLVTNMIEDAASKPFSALDIHAI